MNSSQIWRFPKKYAELFRNMSDEDTGKVIKSLFLGGGDLNGINKAYYDIIKVDLDNLEKTASNGIKGGRPKKDELDTNNEITIGYENNKPQVIESDNLKERKRERERIKEEEKKEIKVKENIVISDDTLATIPLSNNNFRKELIENIKSKDLHRQTVTEMAIILFEDFGYQYNKDETFYTLRDWFVTLSNMHAKKGDEMGKVLFNWHTYWKGQKESKQPKDCKASFSKNPFLASKFDKNENK